MTGEVTAAPWKRDKGARNRWMVYVPPQPMSDGTRTISDRKVITAYSKTEALEWGRERREKLMEEHRVRQRGDLEAKTPRIMTLAKFAEEHWLPHLRVLCQEQQRKFSSIDTIEACLKVHVVPFLGGRRLNEISNNIMTKVMERWIGGGYPDAKGKPVKPTSSPKTLNNRKTVVNACLRFAVERGHIPLMPCRIDIRHVETDEAEHYETGTYERLLEGALALNDARVYVALLLGGDAGLRRGEILALRCEDVKFKTREVTVRRSLYWRRASKGREMVETLPKGKKVKPVATTARLLLALKKICGERTGRVLLTDEGGQLTPKILKLWVIKAELAAGLPGTGRLHVLRHSHLTHLADAGASLLEIASQARHADLRITSRYLHAAGGAGGAARSGVNRLEEKRASAGGVGEGYPR